MVKTKGPCFSLEASGTLGGALTYSKGWKGVKYLRQHKVPANPQTAGQVAQRTSFANGVADYHLQSAETKTNWDTAAKALSDPMSGFNYFVQQYISQGGTPTIPS